MPDVGNMFPKRPTWDQITKDLSDSNGVFIDLRNVPLIQVHANPAVDSINRINELMEAKRILDERIIRLVKQFERIQKTHETLLKTFEVFMEKYEIILDHKEAKCRRTEA